MAANRGLRSKTIKGLRRFSALWNATSELDRMVATHRGTLLRKWKHYYEIYDRHFAPYRDRDITLLEIGIESGGSLQLWREYFGPRAKIVGIDINQKCMAFETGNTFVRIGSQGEASFLEAVAAEFGPFDIVIDDGSHNFEHQIGTFRTLYPHVRASGLYCCEDTCTSYWDKDFGGALRKPGTGIEFFKELVDEQNGWFWRDAEADSAGTLTSKLAGIHFYPTLVVVEKQDVPPPMMVPVGQR